MKLLSTRTTTISFLLLVLLLPLISAQTPGTAQEGTIEVVLRNRTAFSNFVSSLTSNAPSLLARLGNASFESTVFAPLNQDTPFTLDSDALKYYVADLSYVYPTNLTDGALVPSLLQLKTLNDGYQQLKVSVTNATVSINGVEVKELNITATNGVVHALASVLPVPGPLAEIIKDHFSILNSLVANANITLPDACTLFAPSDHAFLELQKTQPALYGYLNSKDNTTLADLRAILTYHALPTLLYAADITEGSQQQTTLEGQPITINKAVLNGTMTVTLNSSSTNASVEAVNALASNGVVHTINGILVPNDFQFTLRKVLLGLGDTTLLNLLEKANLTGYLNDCTIFAPTQEAWQKADESDYSSSPVKLREVLGSFIYNGSLRQLTPNTNLTMLSNKTLHVGNNSLLSLIGEDGSAHVIGSAIAASNGYVYIIDQVLGVEQLSPDSGLSKATIGWIIVGGMGGILLLAAVIVAVVWLVKRKRSGYETINGDVA